MERKNKLVLFLLIVLVMTVALISSFGLNFFAGGGAEGSPGIRRGNFRKG